MTSYIDLNRSFESPKMIRDSLKNKLGIQNLRSDSMVNVISNTVGRELVRLTSDIKTAYEENNYTNATGKNLDDIAFNLFGLKRLPGTYASVYANDYNMIIYLSPYSNYSTFAAANNNASFTIPKGTILTNSISNDSELGNIQYALNDDYILSNQNKIYVSATAITYGASQNIDRGVIKQINFKNYTDSFNNTIIATNMSPIINGREMETDDEFRRRIQLFLRSKNTNNYNDIQLTSLAVPGVVTTEIIPSYYGIGTTGVIVFGPNRLATDKEVADLQRQINSKYFGMSKIYVSKGFYVLLDLEIRMSSRIEISEIDKATITNELKSIINNYILQNYNSQTISLDTIQQEILSLFANRNALEIQLKNGSIFSKRFIRRTSSLLGQNNVGFEVAQNNIKVNRDERLLINDIAINFDYIGV